MVTWAGLRDWILVHLMSLQLIPDASHAGITLGYFIDMPRHRFLGSFELAPIRTGQTQGQAIAVGRHCELNSRQFDLRGQCVVADRVSMHPDLSDAGKVSTRFVRRDARFGFEQLGSP